MERQNPMRFPLFNRMLRKGSAFLLAIATTVLSAAEPEEPAPAAPGIKPIGTENVAIPSADPRSKESIEELLQLAKTQIETKQYSLAEKNLGRILENQVPIALQKSVMMQLADVAEAAGDLAKAQQELAQYLHEFPNSEDAPEILLRQGMLYRKVGAPVMAQSKFYAVMTSALNLKSDQLPRYQR